MKKANIFIFILLLSFSFMANAISYDNLNSRVENKKKAMTEVQFDEYLLTLKGIGVNWRGKVLDVEKDWLDDNYSIKIDMVGDGLVNATFEGLEKAHALTFNKNQEYNFSGEIKGVDTMRFDTMFRGIFYRLGYK